MNCNFGVCSWSVFKCFYMLEASDKKIVWNLLFFNNITKRNHIIRGQLGLHEWATISYIGWFHSLFNWCALLCEHYVLLKYCSWTLYSVPCWGLNQVTFQHQKKDHYVSFPLDKTHYWFQVDCCSASSENLNGIQTFLVYHVPYLS